MDKTDRQQRLQVAVDRLGSKAALGRRLGYRDGAFVGQMLRGERPITEKTIDALARIPQLTDLFRDSTPFRAAEPVRVYAVSPGLSQALELVGLHLAKVPPEMRAAVATNMAGWAQDGGRDHWRTVLLTLLNGEATKLIRAGT